MVDVLIVVEPCNPSLPYLALPRASTLTTPVDEFVPPRFGFLGTIDLLMVLTPGSTTGSGYG